MGLIENCNRVKQNVENIYTVLEENGIVIPEGTTSDNLSGLISTNTVNLDDELAEQDSLLAELQSSLEGKAAGGGSGVELPTLDNPGTSTDLLSGKQLIGQDGNIVNGTFTIDNEINEQANLITQLQDVLLEGETSGGGSGSEGNIGTCTIIVNGAYLNGYIYYTTIDENGSIIPTSGMGKDLLSFTAVCGTHVIFHGMYIGHTSSLGQIYTYGSYDLLWLIDVPSGSTVTVNLTQD